MPDCGFITATRMESPSATANLRPLREYLCRYRSFKRTREAEPRMRLMIVDDEREIREFLASMSGWQAIGCEVAWTAANGEEALGLLQEGALPDVIITDIRMP